jgi:hypothetical protein
MYDYFESDTVSHVLKVLNELPENTEVVAMYARANTHYLWYRTAPKQVQPVVKEEKTKQHFKNRKA